MYTYKTVGFDGNYAIVEGCHYQALIIDGLWLFCP